MQHDECKHQRRSIRIPEYDYSQAGAYFVTICTHRRACLFGRIVRDRMHLSPWGKIVRDEWLRSETLRRTIRLEAYVVMPNHLHGIIVIAAENGSTPVRLQVGAHSCAPLLRKPRSVASFVAQFKASATRRLNMARGTPGAPLWQRNYYEHVLRDADDCEAIRWYIETNPTRWALDEENPLVFMGTRVAGPGTRSGPPSREWTR